MISRFSRKQSGFALVLVLLSLVLLLSIAVGFFLSVTAERQSSHVDASALTVRELGDSTLNVVIAQIKDASSGYATPATSTGTVAWASQPGLIRTFQASLISTANPLGQYQSYKLYSSPTMVVTNDNTSAFDPSTDTATATWASLPALYTDMNAPINRLDPSGTVTIGGQSFSAIYPIVDPSAATGTASVKGFSISGAPTSGTTNPAPMPVQWLYELQDGTLVAGVKSGANTVTVAGAGSSNPIVARVAFWTDDDSCKVNINTAAGDFWTPDNIVKNTETVTSPGSFWDTPRQYSNFDQTGLQTNIQGRNEFQRYPGHPATTYLSAVFPWLTRANIAALSPRVRMTGGSQGGTTIATATITPGSDRLYASVDELAFAQPASGATSRTVQTIITPSQIETTRFFLTAHSRAPELNLFGGPRVTIWPMPSTTANQTVFDQTVALCSTVGGKAYYYVRSDPSSATVDIALGRNPTVYSYLQTAMGMTYPKFGGNFAAKFGADANQILTEIFDYIRCVNLIDSTPGAKPYADGSTGNSTIFGQGTVVPTVNNGTYGMGRFPINNQMALCFFYSQDSGTAGKMIPYILLSKFCPMQGFANMYPTFDETITGLDGLYCNVNQGAFPSYPAASYQNMGFSSSIKSTIYSNYWTNQSIRSFGGNLGMGPEFWDMNNNFLPVGSGYPFTGNAISPGAAHNFVVASTKPIVITITKVGGTTPLQTYTISFTTGSIATSTGALLMQVPLDTGPGFDTFASRSRYKNYYSGAGGNTGPGDSLIGLELGATGTASQVNGDYRMAAILANTTGGIPASEFSTHLLYKTYTSITSTATPLLAASLRDDRSLAPGANSTATGSTVYGAMLPSIPYQSAYAAANTPPYPDFPSRLSQATNAGAQLRTSGSFTPSTIGVGSPGDWDSGLGDAREGAYGGKADEGASVPPGHYPYFNNDGSLSSTNFSPNRQISSAVAFGSLPTGYARKLPWQTLLFCPNPLAGSIQDSSVTAYTSYKAFHPGRVNTPPDYLMLDLFTMPVVEPYAISEPFSTAGKINLNYQIVPFNYITRSTALQAVLRSTRVMALDTSAVTVYHTNFNAYAGPNYRYPINLSETLSDFDIRFANNRPFVSASEICDMYMVPDVSSNSAESANVPTGNTHSNPAAKWWSGTTPSSGFYLTGNNERQKPYLDIYPRLTTQSNSYTVHVRAQKIKMPTNVEVGSWDESVGTVDGEYRGSYSIERYVDPNDSRFVANGGTIDPDSANLNQLYKYRIVETKKFAP